jgi:hypothetical protein
LIELFFRYSFELAEDPFAVLSKETELVHELSEGVGDVPSRATAIDPPSDITFTVSVNDPIAEGLNVTVMAVLSEAETVFEAATAEKTLDVVENELIVAALMEPFLT